MHKITPLIMTALLLVSCKETISSNDVIPDARDGNNRIYRSYRFVHKESDDTTHMTAHFSEGRSGNYVRLDFPASINVNGRMPFSNTDHNGGRLDGSDVAYFYLGFLNPIFWLGLVNIDHGAYYSEMYRSTSTFQMEWVDQLGRSYFDTINRPSFSISNLPSDLNPERDYFVSVNTISDMSSTVTLRFESQNDRLLEPVCTETDIDGVIHRDCVQHYDRSVNFYSNGGVIKIDSEKLKKLPYGDIKISISGRFSKTIRRDQNEGGDIAFHLVKRGSTGYIERTADNQGKE